MKKKKLNNGLVKYNKIQLYEVFGYSSWIKTSKDKMFYFRFKKVLRSSLKWPNEPHDFLLHGPLNVPNYEIKI